MYRSTEPKGGGLPPVRSRPGRVVALVGLLAVLSAAAGCPGGGQGVSAPEDGAGRPQAPIGIARGTTPTVGVGEEGEIEISFTVHSDVESLQLEVTRGKGLALVSSEGIFEYGTQPGGSSFTETVTIRPEREGILYLNVFVSGVFAGRRMARAGAAPVLTGPGAERRALAAPGTIRRKADGTRIIERPIDEAGR